jgi:hypothetical protein
MRALPATGCGSMAWVGATLCFQASCMSACMTRRELWGRWSEIWPARSGLLGLGLELGVGEEEEEEEESWGTMRRTRNSRVTPSEREPIMGRGPR